MEILNLEIFVDVMRHGSFAAAARERGIDPSTVSRAIAGLERELQVRLFQRTTRRLSPTEAGQEYFQRIEPLVGELIATKSAMTDHGSAPAGTIRLSASVAFGQACLVPLLPKLTAEYPDLSIDLVLTDINVDIIADRIDLAIRLGNRQASALNQDLIGLKLFETHYRVCASTSYLKSEGWPVQPAALSSHDCLLLDLPNYRDKWQFRSPGGDVETVPVEGRMKISNPLALREACLAGLGPALLANWLTGEALADGRLIDLYPGIEVSAGGFDTAAWLLYPSRSYLPQKVRVVIDFLKAAFAAQT